MLRGILKSSIHYCGEMKSKGTEGAREGLTSLRAAT